MTSRSTTIRDRSDAERGELVLGRYRLHRRLGTGGFGIVWMARDERLERDVAVKVLPRERVIGGRFEREARAAARLSHPGIVTLYEAAVDDDGAYLVSELVRGATLAELLDAGRLSDRDIASIGVQLCDALAHAHEQGVVHRDVKPSNVLVSDRAAAKLTDFGVARVVGGDSLTRTGDVVGTAAYMSPEQAEGREAGAAADLYSLALVLYEALTGVNPLRTGTAAQRARRLGAHLPPLRRHRRDLPRELGRAIDQALRPRPRERGSLEELRSALAASLEEVEDTPGVVTGPWQEEAKPSVSTARRQMASPRGERAVSERPLAAATAAGLATWLAAAPFTSPPVPPAVAAVMAAIAVAALPRLGWLALIAASTGWLAGEGATGGAVVILLAAFVPVVLLPSQPTRWPLAAVAPGLALLAVAGAWPALAARAHTAWQRAALAATGWIWLQLATPLAGVRPYLHTAVGSPRSTWLDSPYDAVNHLLLPLLRRGAFAPGLVWAAAAATLPVLLRDDRRLLTAGLWSAGVVAATVIALAAFPSAGRLDGRMAVLGMIAAAIVAVARAPRRHRVAVSAAPDIDPGLA